MKTFIFYTRDGFTQDINNKEIENMQVLGFSRGIDKNSAYKDFIKNFDKNNEYCYKEIVAQEVIGNPTYF